MYIYTHIYTYEYIYIYIYMGYIDSVFYETSLSTLHSVIYRKALKAVYTFSASTIRFTTFCLCIRLLTTQILKII